MNSPQALLKELTWGKPVIQLLSNCEKLGQNLPAQMILRHSERISIEKQSEISKASLTETGREAAKAFGRCLPKGRVVRVFHSPVTRCRDTATSIQFGAESEGINLNDVVELPVLNVGPPIDSKFWSDVISDWPHSYNYWLCGRYSTSDAEPSFEYSKRLAFELERLSSNLSGDELDVFVTHDMSLIAALFHWFGVFPEASQIGFLSGFLIQRVGDGINLLVGDSCRLVRYPDWWNRVGI